MALTILLSIMMMAGLFLLLFAGVALIQDKSFFTSAPKDIQAAILPRRERFPGAHALGWFLGVVSILMMLGALVIGAIDGIHAGYGFGRLFGRFLTILLLLKAFDILFFDWVLLCHSGFFPHFYPEVKGLVGPHQFGYNWKTHILHIIAFPVISAVLAWVCALF